MISLQNVSKNFDSLEVLKNVSMQVAAGEVVVVIGPDELVLPGPAMGCMAVPAGDLCRVVFAFQEVIPLLVMLP